MNVSSMVDRLHTRTEDTTEQDFSDANMVTFLNNASLKLANILHPNYLTELKVVETSVGSLTGSAAPYYKAITGLSFGVLRGAQGILAVKINGASNPFCKRVDIKDIRRVDGSFLGGSTTVPIYYVLNNRIYVDNDSTSPTLDVYYLRPPATMAYTFDISAYGTPATTKFLGDASNGFSAADGKYNGIVVYSVAKATHHVVSDYDAAGDAGGDRFFTVTPAAGSNFGDDTIYFISNYWDNLNIVPTTSDASLYVETCDLNPSLHWMVVALAEAECFMIDKQPERAEVIESMVRNTVGNMNAKYVPQAQSQEATQS